MSQRTPASPAHFNLVFGVYQKSALFLYDQISAMLLEEIWNYMEVVLGCQKQQINLVMD